MTARTFLGYDIIHNDGANSYTKSIGNNVSVMFFKSVDLWSVCVVVGHNEYMTDYAGRNRFDAARTADEVAANVLADRMVLTRTMRAGRSTLIFQHVDLISGRILSRPFAAPVVAEVVAPVVAVELTEEEEDAQRADDNYTYNRQFILSGGKTVGEVLYNDMPVAAVAVVPGEVTSDDNNVGEACTDCMIFLANGDLPEGRSDLADDIAAIWPNGWNLSTGGDGVESWFSHSACDCCGSRLGGNRETLFAWHADPVADIHAPYQDVVDAGCVVFHPVEAATRVVLDYSVEYVPADGILPAGHVWQVFNAVDGQTVRSGFVDDMDYRPDSAAICNAHDAMKAYPRLIAG